MGHKNAVVCFDSEKFSAAVSKYMREDEQSCRTLSALTGIGAATINRITRGHKPDVDTFIKILHWLGEDSLEYEKAA